MLDLMQGDCLERMREIPDGSVDMTVTSPPYDNLRSYNGNNAKWGEDVWRSVIRELYRVTDSGGVVVWVVGDSTIKGSETGSSFKQALWAMDCGFNLHDTMIYEKPTVAYPDTNRYYQTFEYMFVWSKGFRKHCNQIRDRKNIWAGHKVHGTERMKDGTTRSKPCAGNITQEYGVRFNVWRIPHVGHKARQLHPATFPEKLAHDHIISWSNEGDTVLDCFMGSGTTGVACVKTGRKFIGIELDEVYFQIAQKRIGSASAKLDNL